MGTRLASSFIKLYPSLLYPVCKEVTMTKSGVSALQAWQPSHSKAKQHGWAPAVTWGCSANLELTSSKLHVLREQ